MCTWTAASQNVLMYDVKFSIKPIISKPARLCLISNIIGKCAQAICRLSALTTLCPVDGMAAPTLRQPFLHFVHHKASNAQSLKPTYRYNCAMRITRTSKKNKTTTKLMQNQYKQEKRDWVCRNWSKLMYAYKKGSKNSPSVEQTIYNYFVYTKNYIRSFGGTIPWPNESKRKRENMPIQQHALKLYYLNI